MNSTWSTLTGPTTSAFAHEATQGSTTGVAGGSRLQRRLRAQAPLALLLALCVATLVVVADRAIHTWTDAHLYLAWLALWAVIFAATALLDSWHRQRKAERAALAATRDSAQNPKAAQRAAQRAEQVAALRRLTELEHSGHSGFLPYL